MHNVALQVAPRGVQFGEIAATKGFNLAAKFVYHGACPSWDHIDAPQVCYLD